jgi:hypothetical protein
LGKGYAKKMVETAAAADVDVAAMFVHCPPERVPWCEFHYLSEHEFASKHGHLPENSGKPDRKSQVRSGR